jgi:hypothetical protein
MRRLQVLEDLIGVVNVGKQPPRRNSYDKSSQQKKSQPYPRMAAVFRRYLQVISLRLFDSFGGQYFSSSKPATPRGPPSPNIFVVITCRV